MNSYTCQHCQTSFFRETKGKHKFCSLSCSNYHRAKIWENERINKYNLSPKMCKGCQCILSFENRKNTYCSQSCSASYTNALKDWSNIRTGPVPDEKFPYTKINFRLCKITGKYYLNRDKNGKLRQSSPYIKTAKKEYYEKTRFKFNVYHYPEEFDINLIEVHGWYTCPGLKRKNKEKNTNGVSRDHIVSVMYGFKNGIDPAIISHPANCRIILQKENISKYDRADLTLEELNEKILKWEEKYGWSG